MFSGENNVMKNLGCSFVCLTVSMSLAGREIFSVENIHRNRIVFKYYLSFPHWQICQSSLFSVYAVKLLFELNMIVFDYSKGGCVFCYCYCTVLDIIILAHVQYMPCASGKGWNGRDQDVWEKWRSYVSEEHKHE